MLTNGMCSKPFVPNAYTPPSRGVTAIRVLFMVLPVW